LTKAGFGEAICGGFAKPSMRHKAKNHQFKEALRGAIGQQTVVDVIAPFP